MNPHLVYLAQTETTVGFLSQNITALTSIKQRPENKSFIISVDSYKILKTLTRIPKAHRHRVRNMHKTTFVYPSNLAIRVVKDVAHLPFLEKLKWSYSTSSNLSGKAFNTEFAQENADVIVFTCKGFFESNPSSIIRLGKSKIKKLR